MQGSGGAPWELTIGRLARRLVDETAMSEEAARWAVESWAAALHGVSVPLTRPAAVPGNQTHPNRRPSLPAAGAPTSPPSPGPGDSHRPVAAVQRAACEKCGQVVRFSARVARSAAFCPTCGTRFPDAQAPRRGNPARRPRGRGVVILGSAVCVTAITACVGAWLLWRFVINPPASLDAERSLVGDDCVFVATVNVGALLKGNTVGELRQFAFDFTQAGDDYDPFDGLKRAHGHALYGPGAADLGDAAEPFQVLSLCPVKLRGAFGGFQGAQAVRPRRPPSGLAEIHLEHRRQSR